MVRGLLERLFDAEKIDAWFENVREVQYIRNISFSSLVSIMCQVPQDCIEERMPMANVAIRFSQMAHLPRLLAKMERQGR